MAEGIFGTTPRTAVAYGLVSAVMQAGGLLKDLTIGETVRLVAALFAHTRSVAEVLALAGLTDMTDRRVAHCSGGEQQRLRFAMALVPEPELIILDEPTTAMDVEGRRAFWSAIRPTPTTAAPSSSQPTTSRRQTPTPTGSSW